MRKIVKKYSSHMALAMTVQPVALKKGQEEVKAAGVADQFTIPTADANGRVGAKSHTQDMIQQMQCLAEEQYLRHLQIGILIILQLRLQHSPM